MSPEKMQDFRGISLKRELVEEIENFIKEFPRYKSKADFVHEATRIRMEEVRKVATLKPSLPPLGHYNLDENGVRVLDRSLNLIVDVIFNPNGIWCDYCRSDDCKHIQFALAVPDVQKIIRKRRQEDWNLPEV